MPCPPIVLICYNRVEVTRRTLAAVRRAAPTEIFLVCDGPRADEEDQRKVAEVRRLLEDEIDWPCTVHRRYSEVNQGCEPTVELGLDWAFTQTDRAVVLEDDCVADPSFFAFCDELLQRYADDPKVAMISGTCFGTAPAVFDGDSYAFTTFSITWGWATWARAWQRHRKVFPRDYAVLPADAEPRRLGERSPDLGLVTAGGRRYFREVVGSHSYQFGWDSHWFSTLAITGSLSVAPDTNMVSNIGFGEESTHTRSTRRMPDAHPIEMPLRHPLVVSRNDAAERGLERAMVHANGRLARTMRKVVRSGPARTVLRELSGRLMTRH